MQFFFITMSLFLLGVRVVVSSPPQPVVTPFAADSFRIQWASPGFPLTNSTYSPFLDEPLSHSRVYGKGGGIVNGNLFITVDAITGLITATRVSDNFVIFTQTALTFGPPIAGGRFPSAQIDFAGHAVDETFVGGGEQGLSGSITLEVPFQRTYVDTEYYGYNQGRQAFLPLFFSSAGYGIMVTNPGYGWLSIDEAPNTCSFNASSIETVEIWITTTPTTPVYAANSPHPFLALLRNYADAVGHAPLMPSFASGFIASKDRYRNQTQFLAVAHGYVDRGIPISMLTIDWFHWAHLGDMSLKSECWPDPQGMVDELRGLGIEIMITHWPFMSTDSVHRAEYEAAGALAVNHSSGVADTFWSYLQEGALITTLSESTRNLTKQKWTDGYGRFGVKATWLDETEPDRTGISNDMLIAGTWQYENTSNTEVGPTWRQQWIRTMTEVLRELHGVGEFFLLSRSAWLGTAKYGHSLWSGDTSSDWETFKLQIPTGLGAGLSGIGLWTSDLGGYSPTMQPFDPKLEELYVRWAQFASVSPLMRLHGHRNGGPPDDPICMQTNGDNEPWTLFMNPVNEAAFIASIVWREQIRNYIMDTQAVWAETGAPMISPVWLLFPGDTNCAFTPSHDDGKCSDMFMFGDSYLAKPITTYQEYTSTIYLPLLTQVGQSWVYVFGNKTNYGRGGVNITIPTPIHEFPLFYLQRS